MSLINEALKKAQRQRTLNNAPLSSAPTGVAAAAVTTHVAIATRRRSSLAPIWFGLGLLVIGVVSTVLIMRYGFSDSSSPAVTSASAPALSPAPATTPAAAPASVAAAAAVPTGINAIPEPSITFTLPLPAPAPTPAPTPAAPAPAASEIIAPAPLAPVAPAPVAPVPTPVTPVPVTALSDSEREARIYAFLSEIRLTGVRGIDREARVLMNEKVFRLNDTVDAGLGLRLSGVRPGLLLFTDAQGRTYEKRH
jgi:hypothetical protein